MQESPTAIPHWVQLALTGLAGILSTVGIDRIYNAYLNRKKPIAEVHVTEATATEIIVRSNATAGDAVVRFMDRLDFAQGTIDRLRAERDSWQDEHDKVFVDRDHWRQEAGKLQGEVRLYEAEVKRMAATLHLENKNYDDTKQREVGPLDEAQ